MATGSSRGQVSAALDIATEHTPTDFRTISLTALDLRAEGDDDEPHFRGWACRNEVRDAYGTTFTSGAWTAGGLNDEPFALCWMHDPWEPVGVFSAADRDEGLWIEGRWDQTRDGRDARTKAKTGSARELSVGFRSVIFDEDDPNRIIAAQLVEVSQITARMAAVPGSEIKDSRSGGGSGQGDAGSDAPSRRLVVARYRLRAATLRTR